MRTFPHQITSTPNHLVVWLDELFSLSNSAQLENQHRSNEPMRNTLEKGISNTRYAIQSEQQIKSYFSNIPGNVEIFHDIDECYQYITENTNTESIFFVILGSTGTKTLPHFTETCDQIKKIYILSDYIPEIIDSSNNYWNRSITMIVLDSLISILIQILKDISKYYLLKIKDQELLDSLSAESKSIYCDWAKKALMCARKIEEDVFSDQLNEIQMHKSEAKKLIRQRCPDEDIERQMQSYRLEEDLDSMLVIFIVNLDTKLFHLSSSIARIIACKTNEQVISTISKVKLPTPIIVVSSAVPSTNLLSRVQSLYYYCLLTSRGDTEKSLANSNVVYAYSVESLMSQLYQKLGEYYRDAAVRMYAESEGQDKAKRLLEKSTHCYKLLESDTEKTLKRYAQLLKNQSSRIHQ